MTLQTAIMAAPDLAEEAGNYEVERRQPIDDAAAVAEGSLSGWRAGAAGAVVLLALVLIAIPVAAALDPAILGQASRLVAALAGLTPLTLAARAVVFVVALAVISRPDGTA